MMVLNEKLPNNSRSAPGNHAGQFVAPAHGGPLPLTPATAAADLADNVQFLSDELAALRRDHAKLQQALFEAAQVQRRLCAPRELTSGEFEAAGEIFPVRDLSGDFFKVMELGSSLGLVLGDIAGKGLSAGIWLPYLLGLVQRCARKHERPSDAVAEVNRELCADHANPPLAALFFARIDPRTNELTYCNAGLPAPLLFRSNKTLEQLIHGGPMLGAVKTASFETGSVTLNPGDMLVAHSDGVTECRNPQDDEFEMHRLTTAAKAVSGMSATKALFSLLATVLDFAGSRSPGDDVTLLMVRRRDALATISPRAHKRVLSALQRRSASSDPALKKPVRGGHSSK